MGKKGFIDEELVSGVWESGHLLGSALRAKDGRSIEIIYQGRRNDESGPDFRDVEIKIDGQTCRGDVEVHVKSSHWKSHRHSGSAKYNNTILHVALWDDETSLLVKKQNGERIPTLILCNYLDAGKLWKVVEEEGKLQPHCAEGMSREDLCVVLDRLGMDRFLHKADVYAERLECSDEDQLLYEGIMEALGYSKNREQFLSLARKVPLKFLIGQHPEKIQAILFGVAGLLSSLKGSGAQTEEYFCKMEALWEQIYPQFQDRLMSEDQWEFFRLRPGNFPTKRIAGISYILYSVRLSNCSPPDAVSAENPFLSTFLSVFVEGNLKGLRVMLMVPAEGYWAYSAFGRRVRFLIGKHRADDIAINVVLPALFVHAQRTMDHKLQQAIVKAYISCHKLQSNKATRHVADKVFRSKDEESAVVNSAMRQQGLISLYKNFCAFGDCQNCPLGERSGN